MRYENVLRGISTASLIRFGLLRIYCLNFMLLTAIQIIQKKKKHKHTRFIEVHLKVRLRPLFTAAVIHYND